MQLPYIYEHFKQGQIFTINEAREKLQTSDNTLRKRLSHLSQKGYISHIRQGLYRLAKLEEKQPQANQLASLSPFAIASKLTSFCYVGFRSALQFHAQIAPKAEDTIFVISPTKFNSFQYAEIHYFWCQNPDSIGIETHIVHDHGVDHPVFITNLEKTLIDCLKRPAHSPNFSELVLLSEKCRQKPCLEKILDYAMHCKARSIFNRLGILFEKNRDHWGIKAEFLALLEQKMSRKQIEWTIPFDREAHQDIVKNRWKITFPG